MVKPPASGPRKQAKVYPPLEAYLRHLLMVRLEPTPSSVSFVTKQLIRFPWNDPSRQCGLLVCKYMLKTCRKGRYKSIQAIANVAASLRRQKPEVFTRLVDAVLEELQWSLEHPDFRDQQRMIAYTRLLGELHCASLAPAQLIFHELYHFINFGHQIPEALRAASEKSSKEEGSEQAGLPSFNSTGKVSQTIHEDEELDEADIQPAKETPVAPKPVAVSKHSKFDPRVPSALDPPNSVIRIKLVCTLLEVVTKSLVTRNNIPKMEVFLAAFQRYLFTKPLLPAEIEFSLLDVFDSIDSRWKKAQQDGAINVKKDADVAAADKDQSQGFTRYTKWLDAHNATVAAEEADAVLEARMQAMLESTAGESQVDSEMLSVDDMATEDPDDEDSDQESIDDPLSTSAKDSYVDEEMESDMDSDEEEKLHESEESEEEESEGSNESEEEEDDMSQEEEFDEEAYMLQLEEEAFERELRRVTMEALEKGKNAVRGQVADTMPSGSQFIKKKTGDVAQETPGSLAVALGGKEGVTFQLLKKGNRGKMEVKQLIVPVDTNLAKQANKQDDEAARERDLIKARVLQYEAESAESEYAGGNVYLEQEKLQVIRNRPLSMEEIDKNFGTSGGNRRSDKSKPGAQPSGGRGATAPPAGGRGAVAPPSGGRGAAAPASGGRGASAGTANAGGGGQGSGGESSAVFTGRGGRAGRGRGNAGGRKLFR
jgi:regulator of nonsense transcripts 2